MPRTQASTARTGYTLLEVILALAIAVLLLGALYVAINLQLRQAQAGRDVIEQAALARNLLVRMGDDISAALALNAPTRYRGNNPNATSATTSSTGTTGTTTGSTPAATGGTTAPAATGAGAAGATGMGSGSSTAGGTSGSSGSTSTDPNSTATGTQIVLPLGVQGDATELSLYVSRVPRELYGPMAGASGVVSDIRCITYALGSGGLMRQEMKVATSSEPGQQAPSVGSVLPSGVFAPEVRSLTFSYFDGTSWQESWDATMPGDDGITPMGSPRAIAIVIALARPGTLPGQPSPLQTFRHVVAIPTANGPTQVTQPTQDGSTP